MRSSEAGDAGGVFRAALLENANLGGDCTHRGALLGAILGMTLGASNLPRDLVDGLVGRQEIFLKPLHPLLLECEFLAGAAALGEGEVMVALDAYALLRRALSIAAGLPSH
jgi:hypothetical protein